MGSDWRQIARDRIAIIKNNSDFRSQVISEKGGDIAYCDICCDIATRLIYIYIYMYISSIVRSPGHFHVFSILIDQYYSYLAQII